MSTLPSFFACPRCRSALEQETTFVTCEGCGTTFPCNGTIDDFAPLETPQRPGLAQRTMQSRLVAPIYEHWVRPTFTRLGGRISYDEEERYLDRHCAEVGGPSVDVACGTGRYTRWLSRRWPGELAIGVDRSLPMLEEAVVQGLRDGLRNTRFLRADAQHLPFATHSVGCVTCFGALHLFPSPDEAIFEIGRVLTAGGSFVCLTAGEAPKGAAKVAQRLFAKAATFRFFADDELAGYLKRGSMELIDTTRADMVLLFAAKKLAA